MRKKTKDQIINGKLCKNPLRKSATKRSVSKSKTPKRRSVTPTQPESVGYAVPDPYAHSRGSFNGGSQNRLGGINPV